MNPTRAGMVWLEPEIEQLKIEFASGVGLEEMTQLHQRTVHGIISKLQSLGLLHGYFEIKQDPWTTQSEVDHLIKKGKYP